MKKRIIAIKIIAFMILLVTLLMSLNQVLKRKELTKPWNMTNKIIGLKNEPRNSSDLMFFGSSHAYCSFIPEVIDENCNTVSYSYATQQQPFWITYHYMIEALKYQSSKIMVLEVFGSKYQDEYADDASNRSAFESLDMSLNKIDLIKTSVNKDNYFEYFVPLVKYHSRWNEISPRDFDTGYYTETDPLRGYVRLDKIVPAKPQDLSNVTQIAPLLPKTEAYLNKIIELTKSQGIKLVLTAAPCNAEIEAKQAFNAVEQIADKNDIPFIDYNMLYDETGIDINSHFYDGGHLNYEGAKAFSIKFARDLIDMGIVN